MEAIQRAKEEKKQKEEKNSILPAMLARNFLCLFLILCGGVISAQEIHFHVVEKDKEEAIPGALIVFNDTEHQLTDWKGEAIVKAKGSSPISVRMMGYQEISWSPAQWMPLLQKGADGKYDCIVVLSPIANESSTLVVSSSLYGRSIRENSQSIERIDGRDILRKRTADLSVAVSIKHSFFYCVFSNCPNVFTSTKETFGSLHYLFSSCSFSN